VDVEEETEDNEIEDIGRKVREALPWVEKYRPTNLEEVVSQDHIVATLGRLIEKE